MFHFSLIAAYRSLTPIRSKIPAPRTFKVFMWKPLCLNVRPRTIYYDNIKTDCRQMWGRTCLRLLLKCDGTRAETRFCLSVKRTSPFKSAGALVQSTTGSRGVRISGSNGSNAGHTMFQRWQFLLHFTSRASPCAIKFQLDCTNDPVRIWWQQIPSKCP